MDSHGNCGYMADKGTVHVGRVKAANRLVAITVLTFRVIKH